MFNSNWWGKTIPSTSNSMSNFDNMTSSNIAPIKYDYKKITGYKAVNTDMKSFYGDFQFEMNKTYTCEEPLKPCRNGFHFCSTLKAVCDLFEPIFGKRYFKVEALVPAKKTEKGNLIPKSCYDLFLDESSLAQFTPFPADSVNKYVAKEITLIEEVPFEEFKEYIKYKEINEENYFSIKNRFNYVDLLHNKWLEKSKVLFSSQKFAEYIFNERLNRKLDEPKATSDKDYCFEISKKYSKAVRIIEAVSEEELLSASEKLSYLLSEI